MHKSLPSKTDRRTKWEAYTRTAFAVCLQGRLGVVGVGPTAWCRTLRSACSPRGDNLARSAMQAQVRQKRSGHAGPANQCEGSTFIKLPSLHAHRCNRIPAPSCLNLITFHVLCFLLRLDTFLFAKCPIARTRKGKGSEVTFVCPLALSSLRAWKRGS